MGRLVRQKLTEAKCVVVLWSKHSIESRYVRHETTIAHDEEKIIPVMLDPLKSVKFPMGLYDSRP
ncbi:MAG: toll/interleukin-1 receptor domain-containing protein [Methyloceanibacter sp.]